MKKIVRNVTEELIPIFEAGITLHPGMSYEIPANEYHFWDNSPSVDAAILEGRVVVNTGTEDLLAEQGLAFIKGDYSVVYHANTSDFMYSFEDFLFSEFPTSNQKDSNLFEFVLDNNDGEVSMLASALENTYEGVVLLKSKDKHDSRPLIESFNRENRIKLGSANFLFETRARIETLSTSLQKFTTLYGLADISTIGMPANGMFFHYDISISPNWLFTVTKNSAITTFTTPIPVVANEWFKLKLIADGNRVLVYINSVQVGSLSIAPPTSAMRFLLKLEKKVGTSERTTSIDYLVWRRQR